MEHSDPRQQPLTHQNYHHHAPGGPGVVPTTNPMAYATPLVMATGIPAVTVSSSANFAPQHFPNQQHQQQLQSFWANQMHEIDRTVDFKNHSLPLARIKKIMKSDEDVRMISAEAPVIFAKACEMFILELTLRSWIHTEENKRRTLHKNDIAAAISRTDVFDFLVDIVPRDESREEGLEMTKGAVSGADGPPYYFVPPGLAGAGGVMVGKHADEAGVYAGQAHRASHPFVPWMQSNVQHPAQPEKPEKQLSD